MVGIGETFGRKRISFYKDAEMDTLSGMGRAEKKSFAAWWGPMSGKRDPTNGCGSSTSTEGSSGKPFMRNMEKPLKKTAR